MIQWLQNYSGTGIHGENFEKNELENLRKELKYYRKKFEKEMKDIEIISEDDEYIDAFVDGYGRKPKPHNENLVFVGNPLNENIRERSRLAVMNDRDYEKWAYNQMPMLNDKLIIDKDLETQFVLDCEKITQVGAYRVEYGPDGKKCTIGLNPLSVSNAYCDFCGKLFNLDEEADKCKGLPEYGMRYEKELHFCSMKCRMAYKNEHNLTPEQMRVKTTKTYGNEDLIIPETKKSNNKGKVHRTNY